jgi:hypothetical protein
MKKHKGARREETNDSLEIPELGPEFFANAVMGKYYARTMARSNVVRIAPDLCQAFPNEAAVNQALRELLKFEGTLKQITADRTRRKTA